LIYSHLLGDTRYGHASREPVERCENRPLGLVGDTGKHDPTPENRATLWASVGWSVRDGNSPPLDRLQAAKAIRCAQQWFGASGTRWRASRILGLRGHLDDSGLLPRGPTGGRLV